MVRFKNTSDNIESIISKYSEDSMERQVLDDIVNSEKTFVYKNAEELIFEAEMRAQLVYASIALHRSDLRFAVFRKTICNEEYWDRQRNGGFKLKSGVRSSKAIADILENSNMYGTECATAMVIAYYLALLQMYPEKLFDKVFSDITLMNWHSIDRKLREIGMMNRKSYNIIGDRRYFKNPDVDLSVPHWQGENVIDLGNDRYYGHGIGIRSAEKIIKHLNDNRKDGSTVSAYLMDTAGNPDYKELYSVLENYLQRVSVFSA